MTQPLAEEIRSDAGTRRKRRAGSAVLWWMCLVLAPCWAVNSALFCVAEFMLAMQPQATVSLIRHGGGTRAIMPFAGNGK